jgi:hypothetical protein
MRRARPEHCSTATTAPVTMMSAIDRGFLAPGGPH